jgi:predicted membrane protein
VWNLVFYFFTFLLFAGFCLGFVLFYSLAARELVAFFLQFHFVSFCFLQPVGLFLFFLPAIFVLAFCREEVEDGWRSEEKEGQAIDGEELRLCVLRDESTPVL